MNETQNRPLSFVRISDGKIISSNIETAYTFGKRFRGLMFRKSLAEGSSMHIKPCGSVHCFFMRYPIDVVFLSGDGKIVHIIKEMKPWRVSKIYAKAESVLELPSGYAQKVGLNIGDRLKIC